MKVIKNITEWQETRDKIPSNLSIGFVATMGNLHIGHASLLKKSCMENDLTVASIFVNPAQFNNKDDLVNYPRSIDKDLEMLEKNNVDYCLIPNEEDIYPDNYCYQINEIKKAKILEGEHRPGHFTGVLTIVMKLFNLVKPSRAYFGEKDYQQFQLIRDMTKSFFMDIEVKSCPTIREESGLAFSSRNNLLNSDEKIMANQFAHILHNSQTCAEITDKLTKLNIEVIYVEDYNSRRYVAVKIGNTRLIDNILLA